MNSVYSQSRNNYSQSYNRIPKSVLFGLGVSAYYGDLQTQMSPNPSFMLGYIFPVSAKFNLRLSASYFRISGHDSRTNIEELKSRNLSFKANNYELALILEVILALDKSIQPYGMLGIGASTNNPFTDLDGEKILLRKLRTENVDYPGIVPVFPVGLGLKFKIFRGLSLKLEASYRFTLTDYLDDVSTKYQDPESLGSDLARKLSDRKPELGIAASNSGDIRGNPDLNDGYLALSASLELSIQKFIKKRNRAKYR